MRIISGIYGGVQLVSKIPSNIRPTTDLSRESLFNVLSNLIDINSINVLDLFAGTGALGIESISRGAKFVQFVDKSFPSINLIKMNLNKLKIDKSFYRISQQDVLKYLMNENTSYDLIFADPPYELYYFDNVINKIITNNILSDQGIIIFELSSLQNIIIPEEIEIIKVKEFGKSKFYFLKHKK